MFMVIKVHDIILILRHQLTVANYAYKRLYTIRKYVGVMYIVTTTLKRVQKVALTFFAWQIRSMYRHDINQKTTQQKHCCCVRQGNARKCALRRQRVY